MEKLLIIICFLFSCWILIEGCSNSKIVYPRAVLKISECPEIDGLWIDGELFYRARPHIISFFMKGSRRHITILIKSSDDKVLYNDWAVLESGKVIDLSCKRQGYIMYPDPGNKELLK